MSKLNLTKIGAIGASSALAVVMSASGALAFGGSTATTFFNTTGPGSLNEVDNTVASFFCDLNAVMTDVQNPVMVSLHSGNLSINDTTSALGITGTGNVGFAGMLATSVDPMGGSVGPVIVGGNDVFNSAMTETGPDSSNIITNTDTTNVALTNMNNTSVVNAVDASLRSGDARIHEVTTASGAIGTGNVNFGVGVSNTVGGGDNTPLVVNAGGMTANTAFMTTGPGSANLVTNSSTNTISVSNSNSTNLTNAISLHGHSGSTNISDVTTATGASTGDVNGLLTITNNVH